MKRHLFLCAMMLVGASFGSVNAQSLLDMLNSLNSSSSGKKAEPAPVEKINKDALTTGMWKYSGAAVEFTGTDLVAMLGSSMASASIKQGLETYYTKAGIEKGSCTLVFMPNNKYAARTARENLEGKYDFDHQNQKVKVEYNHSELGGKGLMDARLKFTAGKLHLMFEADKVVALIKEMTKEIELDQNIKDMISMISEYKGLYLGFELEK